jgi:hypothetical protein
MVEPLVEWTAESRLDLLAELHGVAQAQVSLVLLARPPHLDFREMVGALHAPTYW